MPFKFSENKNILKHLGIIMDGNRRWAKSKKLDSIEGHKKGIETAKIIINEAIKKKNPLSYFICIFLRKLEKRTN